MSNTSSFSQKPIFLRETDCCSVLLKRMKSAINGRHKEYSKRNLLGRFKECLSRLGHNWSWECSVGLSDPLFCVLMAQWVCTSNPRGRPIACDSGGTGCAGHNSRGGFPQTYDKNGTPWGSVTVPTHKYVTPSKELCKCPRIKTPPPPGTLIFSKCKLYKTLFLY